MEVQGKCSAIQHQCCAAHLLRDLSVFVESAGEVAGTAGNAMSGCWPWENSRGNECLPSPQGISC